MTIERVDQLLAAMNGQPDDMAALFINGWSAPEITCGELRRLLTHFRRAETRYEIIGSAKAEPRS